MVQEILFEQIKAQNVPQFSAKDKAYMTQSEKLSPYWKFPMDFEAFEEVIEERKKYPVNRTLLNTVARQQYEHLGQPVNWEIDLSSENTFTITTAHQPGLMTGPLYFIYKAISAIKLCRKLKQSHPDYDFQPVFVIGGEDHDFEEINHFRIFGKTLSWDNQGQVGACGRMETKGMEEVLEQLYDILGESTNALELKGMLEEAYGNASFNYGQATQHFVLSIFKNTELLVLNMDEAAFKRAFLPVMKRELLENFSKPLVSKTIEELNGIGFKMQAFPREINLFYLSEEGRNRIVLEDDQYTIHGTSMSFSEKEILELMDKTPEAFSPNVVMRPLYQETILPNLAYVGGGGEIAYWLERKSQFEEAKLPFPMLVRRDSVLWVDKASFTKWTKLGLELNDLFADTEELKKEYVRTHSENEISLEAELTALQATMKEVAAKAAQIDKSLLGRIEAESAKLAKTIDGMEKRLQKAEKQKFTQALSQIEKIKEKLFPASSLQERKDNFMGIYLKHGSFFMETLLESLQPMDPTLKVFIEAD